MLNWSASKNNNNSASGGGSLCMILIWSKININLENEDDNQRMSQSTTHDNHFAPDCINQKSIVNSTEKKEKEKKIVKMFFRFTFSFAIQFSVDLMLSIFNEKVNNRCWCWSLDGRCTYAIFVQSEKFSRHSSNFFNNKIHFVRMTLIVTFRCVRLFTSFEAFNMEE